MGDEEKIWNATLILVAVLLGSMAAGIARPSIALLVRYGFKASIAVTASLTSGFMAGRASMSLLAGVLGDIDPGKRRLLAGVPLIITGVILYYLPESKSTETIILEMGLWGLMAGLSWPTAQTLMADASVKRRGILLSLYFATGTFGVALGNWLFGMLEVKYSGLIKISGGLLGLAGIILLIASKDLKPTAKRGIELKEISKILNKRIAWILYSAFTAGFLIGLLREYFYVIIYEEYGLTKTDLGYLLSLGSIAAFTGGLLVGPLSDRIGIQKTLLGVMIIGLIASILLSTSKTLHLTGLGYILAMVTGRSSLPLTRNAGLLGVGKGGSTVVGLSNTLSNLGNMISPLIAGLTYSWNIVHFINPNHTPFILPGILLVINIVWYLKQF